MTVQNYSFGDSIAFSKFFLDKEGRALPQVWPFTHGEIHELVSIIGSNILFTNCSIRS